MDEGTRTPDGSPREGGRRSVLLDAWNFLLRRAAEPTLIDATDPVVRREYGERIAQRLGLDVNRYSVLDIHRVGIDAPVRFVFEELRQWSGSSLYWPNALATVESVDAARRHIKILALGRWTWRLRHSLRLLPREFGRLFEMTAETVQADPSPAEFDNARYVLYRCSGGYPIGIFGMFVRSPVASRGETEPAQLFFAVGFDFFGRPDWPGARLVERAWRAVHDRATANILCRFKRECEARFRGVTGRE